MPLHPGHSRAVVSNNIREMIAAGHPQRQAVAAALSNARRHPKAYAVGGAAGLAGIGAMAPFSQGNPLQATPWQNAGMMANTSALNPQTWDPVFQPQVNAEQMVQMKNAASNAAAMQPPPQQPPPPPPQQSHGPSVLCSYLFDRRLISPRVAVGCLEEGKSMTDWEYLGYRAWADVLIRMAGKNKTARKFLERDMRLAALYMARRQGYGGKTTARGVILHGLGRALSWALGLRRRKECRRLVGA